MSSINHPQASSLLSQTSAGTPCRHPPYPQLCAHPIYDLSSPIFSASEVASIFSPASQPNPQSSGWTALNSRMEHITNRPPTLQPKGLCVGEYTSASVAHPCITHGVGQVFHNWNTHPATKRFREMIASTPVVQPMGHGPAQILKGYLDGFDAGRSPLEGTWVLKFLLLPKPGKTQDGWWEGRLQGQGGDWCDPADGSEKEFKSVALICVREGVVGIEETSRKLVEFGKLFSVEVVIVASLG